MKRNECEHCIYCIGLKNSCSFWLNSAGINEGDCFYDYFKEKEPKKNVKKVKKNGRKQSL